MVMLSARSPQALVGWDILISMRADSDFVPIRLRFALLAKTYSSSRSNLLTTQLATYGLASSMLVLTGLDP